ncbi:MAG: hypothetical protein FWC95_03995 [Defluviitaleaceae bacterium]|nr:hypothetical protein [Defluviitaleaceae bacterium]
MAKASFVAGTVLGVLSAAGIGYALSDARTRRKICRRGRKIADKLGDTVENLKFKR